MTREDAIEILQGAIKKPNTKDGYLGQAIDMAIKALSQEPTNTWSIKDVADTFKKHGLIREQEPCDDAISREAVIEWLENATYEDISYAVGTELSFLPSVTQKSGVWVEIDDEPHEVWECDHCGFVIDGSGCIEPYEYRDTYKFCPNCGAKMVEPQESDAE